jgi:hypothetical protein
MNSFVVGCFVLYNKRREIKKKKNSRRNGEEMSSCPGSASSHHHHQSRSSSPKEENTLSLKWREHGQQLQPTGRRRQTAQIELNVSHKG